MSNPIVRLFRIEIKNFKNIKYGELNFSDKDNNGGTILGIYGQNGSGKTAVVDVMSFLKKIVSGQPLPDDTNNYINFSEKEAEITYTFTIENTENYNSNYQLKYSVVFQRREKGAYISKEVVNLKKDSESSIILGSYDSNTNDTIISPQVRQAELLKNNKKKNYIGLEIAKNNSLRDNISFMFSDEVIRIYNDNESHPDFSAMLDIIRDYVRYNLYVIPNDHSATISLDYMQLAFRNQCEDHLRGGNYLVELLGVSHVTENDLEMVTSIINHLNIVLSSIIPNLKVTTIDLGTEISLDKKVIHRIEFLSKKGDVIIPLKYESEGIKKIISILSALISMFNNPSVCVVIDELDSGIYEYLLGELLEVIENGAKGQLIFTSHNLRVLEKIKKDSIVFTTTNPKNRFVKLSYIKSNNNLRDVYLRGIDLGGLKEELYEETDSYKMAFAFRKAGDCIGQK